MLDRVEAWGPVAHWLRDRPVIEEPYECGGYLGRLDDFAGGLPHYNYAGEEISFREAMVAASDPAHYHVGNTYVNTWRGMMRVSTIFPGMQLGFHKLLFETMIEHDSGWLAQYRHATLAEATEAHREICDELAQSWWTNLGGRA